MSAEWMAATPLAAVAALAGWMVAGAALGELPKGYKQILPRGRIASIDGPRFVPAATARIPGDAWVLGVVVEGKARAYSLSLLNHHEIVNDHARGASFAAVLVTARQLGRRGRPSVLR